jgi:hypothetical protein
LHAGLLYQMINTKRPRLNYLFQVVIFLGLIGCLSPIDIPVEIAGGRLVVSGQISTLSDQNIIELGVTANSLRLPIPESFAAILLVDDQGNSFSYTEDSQILGRYLLVGLNGIPGRTYHLEITLRNGKKYTSVPETMPNGSVLSSTKYEMVREETVDLEGAVRTKDFIKIYADSKITSAKTFLKWNVQETFKLSPTDYPDPFGYTPPPCFIIQNADPQRVTQFDGSAISTSIIQGQLVASREIDWTFIEKHYFTTYQSSITKEALDYWRKVNILGSQVGSIFDTPPAEITGNIISVSDPTEKTLGYFQVANQSYQRFVIYQSDLLGPILYGKCDFDGSWNPNHYPGRCINCLTVLNSSHDRPEWF